MRRIEFTNTQVASSETARDINRGVVLNSPFRARTWLAFLDYSEARFPSSPNSLFVSVGLSMDTQGGCLEGEGRRFCV